MRALKMAGLICAAVFGLVLIFIGWLTGFFNPNDYKPELEAQVKAQTGRTFTLQGPLSVTLWPHLGVAASQLRLDAAAGFGPEPMVQAQRVVLEMQWWPLLRHRLVIQAIELEGVHLNLARAADGTPSWQDLIPHFTGAEPRSTAHATWTLERLGQLKLEQASVDYIDHMNERQYQVDHLNFNAQDVTLREPFAIQGSAEVSTNSKLSVEWRAQLLLAVDQQRYALNDAHAEARMTGEAWPSAGVPIELTLKQLQFDQSRGQATLEGFTCAVAQARVQGQAAVSGLNDHMKAEAQLQWSPLNVRDFASQLGKPLPPMRDARALSMMTAQMSIAADENSLRLALSDLKLDETRLNGEVQLIDFSQPQWTFMLHADRMNLDRYLNPSPSTETTPVPLQWLRGLQARGTLTIDQAQWQGIHTQGLVLQVDGE